MLARLQADVIDEKPDLVIWQLGTNSVLRDHPLVQVGEFIEQGLTDQCARPTSMSCWSIRNSCRA